MSRGKAFERELLKSMRSVWPDAYVERNTDRMAGRGTYSAPSPPDIIMNGDGWNMLIECKAVKGQSIPLNRLSPHQHDYLVKYDRISWQHEGHIAVCFYKPRSWKTGWLIPVGYWDEYAGRYPRKSIALKHLTLDLPEYELEWDKGEKLWTSQLWI